MDTMVRTPLDVFNLPQHIVVPLFQRPYVWGEEEQWAPLWQDIVRMANLRLVQPGSRAVHFLGAVVLQAQENQTGTFQPRHIIDGQQRLTTLQLLMDSVAAVLEERGFDNLALQLESLTHNQTHFVKVEEDVLKLRHTNRDRQAFDQVMNAEVPIDYDALDHQGSKLVAAHRYFGAKVDTWMDIDETPAAAKADAITDVLTRGLQLVVIDLRSDEDSQEIFETLNARGAPLTAADLIKNFVFQKLSAEGSDTQRAYLEDWPFESHFWEKEVSIGRYFTSRSSVFLNQWLGARTGEEVSPKSTFSRFKSYVEHESSLTMGDLLPVIKCQANMYESWVTRAADKHADLTRVELNFYRTGLADLEVLKPLIIWLHEPESKWSTSTVDQVIASAESWIMRRSLLRLTTADLGRIVADLTAQNAGVPDAELPGRVDAHLSRLNASSTYWPGDEEIRSALRTQSAYRRFKRGRLRMYLEAAEDHLRGYSGSKSSKTGTRIPRTGLPIEHLMPQKWKSHWPVSTLDEELDRNEHLHRLGNLTLITASLNASISNGPWLGEKGKRAKLEDHDVLLLNRRLREMSEEGWDEEKIDERTTMLADALLSTWGVPDGHLGEISDRESEVSNTSVSVKHLLAGGLLKPQTELQSRRGSWGQVVCVVDEDGTFALGDTRYETPSAAGAAVRGGATNGWKFWSLADGRLLSDLRDEYAGRRVVDR